ncbi:hypothetical protein FISHEDRAFT_76010 [Fistulina hepatica ATCC 64428]|uniref:Uncharacterized protein n=1 Tax=Fistulina hepatica ATCC 64428 TaxID=1128425 RepID=A0A0D7A715_9AGAR|nr:hypothetical protein FISHEDRAFT_76010 [Fistulina hepatica ATCC 64428]
MPNIVSLPQIMDPLLDYLQDVLPGPVFAFVLAFLSHFIALISALAHFAVAVYSKDPADWDVQTVLPPLISLLAAWFAVYSFYCATVYAIRKSIWIAKWTAIICVLVGCAVWVARNQVDALQKFGLAQQLTDFAMGYLNSGFSEDTPRRDHRRERPKPWDSFDRHREWQYDEQEEQRRTAQGGDEVQKVIDGIARFVKDAAKDVRDGRRRNDNTADSSQEHAAESH